MTTEAVLDGNAIRTQEDFHREIARALDLPKLYGENLNALWDVMTGMLTRPVTLMWRDSEVSKEALGNWFERVVSMLREVEDANRAKGWDKRFALVLE